MFRKISGDRFPLISKAPKLSSPTIETLRQIEAICSRFEDQIDGGDLTIASILGDVPVATRGALLCELVAIDAEHRWRRGDQPTADDYVDVAGQCVPPVPRETIDELIQREVSPTTPRPASVRYDFVERIGRGGNGDVWRVYDRESQRTLAIKVLNGRSLGDESAVVRLNREAIVTGKLQHPGIPPIYDRGRLADGTPYFSMKLIGGETFASILQDVDDRQRMQRCLGIFENLSQTVAYAHSHGVVHRDLKPQNVMVGAFGEVQVMDWGMAKRISPDGADGKDCSVDGDRQVVCETRRVDPGRSPSGGRSESMTDTWRSSDDESWNELSRTLTMAGDVMGTPAYMSPEQARGETDTLDHRTDVFTLGVILFEILTATRLHGESSVAETIFRTASGRFDDVRERLAESDTPEDLAALCEQCLQLDPAARPDDATQVADAITSHLETAEQRARQAEIRSREATVRVSEDRKRRRLQTRMAVLVATVSLVGAAIAAWQWRAATEANAKTADALTLADQRFEDAQRVVDNFLTDVADEQGLLATLPGAQPVRLKMLQQARQYYEEFLAQADDDPTLQFKVAQAYKRMGEIEMIVDPGGEDVIEYYKQVIAACDHLMKEEPTNLDYLRLRGSAYQAIGGAHKFTARHELAHQAYTLAKSDFAKIVELRGIDRDHLDLAIVNRNLGHTAYDLKRYDESQRFLDAALARSGAMLEQFGDEADVLMRVRAMHNSMGALKGWGRRIGRAAMKVT